MIMPTTNAAVRVLIADAEPVARSRLRALLSGHPAFRVVAETSTGPDTVRVVDEQSPDVLFLDTSMPGLSGIEVMAQLGSQLVPAVVFVTDRPGHAVEAFDHSALDYLLKPVREERLRRSLDRVLERIEERRALEWTRGTSRMSAVVPTIPPAALPSRRYPAQLLLRSTKRIAFLPVSDIRWVQARSNYVRLHTADSSELHRSTLAAIEQQLDPTRFVRIHRSTIVQWSFVRELRPYFRGEYIVVLDDGTQLKLTRSYRTSLETFLGLSL